MEFEQAIERVLLGEPLDLLAGAQREDLLRSVGIEPDEVDPTTFRKETRLFMNRLCRALGEVHAGDHRALAALRDWLHHADDYEAYDALLTHFDFEGKGVLVERGRMLFAGPMTSHWEA